MRFGVMLFCIVVLGVLVAWGVGLLNGRATVQDLSQYHGDARVYIGSALSLLHDGSLYDNNNPYRKPPMYSAFLALSFGVFGEYPYAIWILHIVFLVGSLLCLYAVSARFFTGFYTYIPALALALFWGNAVYVFKVGSEAPAVFLILYLLYLGMRMQERPRRRIAIAWSVVLVLIVLMKPIMLYATPILLFLVFRNKSRDLILAGACVIVMVGGWMIHNYIQRGTYQIEEVGSIVYARGLVSEAPVRDIVGYGLAGIMGDYIADIIIPGYGTDPLASRAFKAQRRFTAEQTRAGHSYSEVDKMLIDEGRGRIVSNPIGFFAVAAGSVFELNGPMTLHGISMTHFLVGSDTWIERSYFVKIFRNLTGSQRQLSGVLKVSAVLSIRLLWLAFLALVIYGYMLAWKRGAAWWPILFLIAYFTFMHALVVVPAEVRFLVPVRSLYVLLAALACHELFIVRWNRAPKDYRVSHMPDSKSKQYDDVIYRRGSYDDMLWQAEQPILLQEVSQLRKNVRKIAYLDFGSGTGRILKLLEGKVDDALGVDISASMIALAREKGVRAPMLVGDITKEDIIGSKTFQLITVFRVFLNAGPDLSRQMLGILTPKLDSAGILIFNMHGNIWSHRLFTKIWFTLRGRRLNTSSYYEVKNMLDAHGLEIVKWYGFGFMPKIFYRIFGTRAMFALDSLVAKISLSKYISYNLLFVCKRK